MAGITSSPQCPRGNPPGPRIAQVCCRIACQADLDALPSPILDNAARAADIVPFHLLNRLAVAHRFSRQPPIQNQPAM